MAEFPTLYRHGAVIHQPVVESMEGTLAHDPAIRSMSEGGYVTSRARFTRLTRRWNVRYEWMTKAQAITNITPVSSIKTFEEARCGGAEAFSWKNNLDNTYYTVRFLEPVRYIPHANSNFLWWTVEFMLEQV